jgi:hypothetical protein
VVYKFIEIIIESEVSERGGEGFHWLVEMNAKSEANEGGRKF